MTTTETIIQIEDLTKIFYTDEIETHALSGVHLNINRGEYVAMSGPSGCGKSTLLSIIGLLDTPTAGRYTLNSKEVANLNLPRDADFDKDGVLTTAELDAYAKQVLPQLANVFPQLLASRRDVIAPRACAW